MLSEVNKEAKEYVEQVYRICRYFYFVASLTSVRYVPTFQKREYSSDCVKRLDFAKSDMIGWLSIIRSHSKNVKKLCVLFYFIFVLKN